jgi:hypothetical protein
LEKAKEEKMPKKNPMETFLENLSLAKEKKWDMKNNFQFIFQNSREWSLRSV